MDQSNIHPEDGKPNDESVNSTSGEQSPAQGEPQGVAPARQESPERAARRARNEALARTECDVLIPFVWGWQRAHGLPVGAHATVLPHGPVFPDMAAQWDGWLAAAHDQDVLPELHVLYPNAARDGAWCQRRGQLIEKYLASHPKDRVFIKGNFVHDVIGSFGIKDYVELVGPAPWAAEAEARSAAVDEKAAERRRQETVKAQIKQFHQENGIAVADETAKEGETKSGDTEPTKKPAPGAEQEAKTSKPTGGWKGKPKAGAKAKPMLMVDDPKLHALVKAKQEAGLSQRDIALAVEPDYGRKVSQSMVNKIIAKLRGGG